MAEPDRREAVNHGLMSAIFGKERAMYGIIVMIVIASVGTFAFTHSWVAGLLAGLLTIVLNLAFSGFGKLVRGLRSKS